MPIATGPVGPQLVFSDRLHATKYREKGEDFRAAVNRQASAMSDDDEHFHQLRDIYGDMRFMNAGRVQAAMGSPKMVTAYNCFVSGTIADSFVDGPNSIAQMTVEAATTMRMGGGIGYDFSTLRPAGDRIAGVDSTTDGPIAFMPVFDAWCKATSSSGNRRGAQMAVLRVDHPDIEAFIRCKRENGVLSGFNISVGVTDKFMIAVQNKERFALTFGGKVYRYIDAAALWEEIMRLSWDWAEPGVLFIDTINRMNNLWYCEYIAATNPCGEQPLPPYGACLLGSVNAVRYVTPAAHGFTFNWEQLARDIAPCVRALDNVIDRTQYPLPQQAEEARAKRRMGIGVTGMANAIEACGYRYGTTGYLHMQERIMKVIRDEAYRASIELAKEKGPFPLYDERYLQGQFIKTLPEDIQEGIAKYGIRNSHLTSVAPTGTISFCADYVSSGIEPVLGIPNEDFTKFEYEGSRKVNMPDGQITVEVSDYGYREFGVEGRMGQDVSPQEHIAVLAAATRMVDSSVSKTTNVSSDMPWENFKSIYMTAWETGCKGCTTFTTGGKRESIFGGKKPAEEVQGEACFIQADGTRSCE